MVTTSSTKQDKSTNPLYKELFDYWNKIPVIKIIETDEFHAITDHHYRNAMTQILRKGIMTPSGKTRHALSLKELVKPMEQFLAKERQVSESIKITALYHHRDILMEAGIIKEIATILEGKRYVSYYGRTAKAFLANFSESSSDKETSTVLRQLLNRLHNSDDLESVNPLLTNFEEELKEASKKAMKWIEEHAEIINELDLDTIILYQILIPFFAYNTEISNSIRDLLEHE